MQSRWFDFGGDTIVRTDSLVPFSQFIALQGLAGSQVHESAILTSSDLGTFDSPLIDPHKKAGYSPGCH